MSNLKHLNQIELKSEFMTCTQYILSLKDQQNKIAAKINGQQERLKWISYYMEKYEKRNCPVCELNMKLKEWGMPTKWKCPHCLTELIIPFFNKAPKTDKKFATQIKLDVLYNNYNEVSSLIDAIHDINKNDEWDITIPYQSKDTEDMTEHYIKNSAKMEEK